jgi:Na+/melibiose symporter-like transporter
MSMGVKFSIALSFVLVGPMLTWVGYVPGLANLTAPAAENMRRLFAFMPAAIFGLSALVFMRYPSTRQRHREMRELLVAKEAASAASLKAG